MEKVSSEDDEEHIARMRGLLRSRSSLKRSTTSSPIHKTYSRSRVSSGPSDAGIRKRVKFSVSSTICEPEPMRNGPLPQNEGAHLAYIDGGKTSEFKSFKRLLEKTTHKHYFDEVVETDIKLKKCKAALSKGIQSKSDVRSSSLPVQYGSSILQGFLSSSPALVLQKQEFKNNAEGNNGAARSLPDQLLHPSPLIVGKSCGGEHSVAGTMQQHKGTFSIKRACLLQLAACRTHLQNVDDFLSNRSDFILEILQRLGIKRNSNKNEKLQNAEQKIDALQFLAPSKRSNHIVEFSDNYSQENSPTYETKQQYANLLALTLDNTEIPAFPYNHSLQACSTLLPDYDEASSTIELIEEFDCRRYSGYTDKAHPLLNSPFDDVSEINVFPIDYATRTRQSYHFNETLDCKELFDLCAAKLEKEEDYSSHRASLGRNYEDSFHADCILFDNSNSENFFRGQLSLSLMGWDDATTEKELPTLKRLLPKDMDKFTESQYDDAFDSPHEIGSSNFFDVYEGKSFSFFTELQF